MQSSKRFWLISAVVMALMTAGLAIALVQWNLINFSNLARERLMLINQLRQGALQEYFATAEAELRFWSTSPEVIEAQKKLQAIWNEGGSVGALMKENYSTYNPHPKGFYRSLDDAGDGTPFSALHRELHPRAKLFVTERGYYDFFLIGPEGNVLYSVEKEADFASNLSWGLWNKSGLARIFERARRGAETGVVALSDMQPYAPSENAPAMFMATAINDQEGEFLGVVAVQLPTDVIVSIMGYNIGMGETGETYLVGQDGLMRSNSRFIEESTILSKQVDTVSVQRALSGESGVDLIQDYRDVDVLSAYSPMEVGNTEWVVLAEMDLAEVAHWAARDRPSLAGALLSFYGLSLWTLWYWRGRHDPMREDGDGLAGLDLSDPDGGGFGA